MGCLFEFSYSFFRHLKMYSTCLATLVFWSSSPISSGLSGFCLTGATLTSLCLACLCLLSLGAASASSNTIEPKIGCKGTQQFTWGAIMAKSFCLPDDVMSSDGLLSPDVLTSLTILLAKSVALKAHDVDWTARIRWWLIVASILNASMSIWACETLTDFLLWLPSSSFSSWQSKMRLNEIKSKMRFLNVTTINMLSKFALATYTE